MALDVTFLLNLAVCFYEADTKDYTLGIFSVPDTIHVTLKPLMALMGTHWQATVCPLQWGICQMNG